MSERFITEDRRCVQCGTPVESAEGEPADQVADSRGFMVTLSAWYTLQPCGHTFRRAFERVDLQ